MRTKQTCKYGTGLCSLTSIRVGQGEELVNVVRLEEASLFGVLQNTIGQKLFEDLPELQQIQYRIRHFCVIQHFTSAGNPNPLSPQSSLADG